MDRIRTKIVTQVLQLFEGNLTIETITEVIPILFPKQNKVNTETLIKKSIEMYCSLQRAVDEAGGAGWNSKILEENSVIDLITTLGVNNVRFVYTKTKENIEKKYTAKHKLTELKIFANEMLYEFEEQLKADSGNLIAAMAIDIYKEIIEKIKE